MTRTRLLETLKALAEASTGDAEDAHGRAESALLEYLNDDEITLAYSEILRW